MVFKIYLLSLCMSKSKTVFSPSELDQIASANGWETKTVIPHMFENKEFLTVSIETFKTVFFLMDNKTFGFTYSHTYDAKIDKTTKRLPKQFKK